MGCCVSSTRSRSDNNDAATNSRTGPSAQAPRNPSPRHHHHHRQQQQLHHASDYDDSASSTSAPHDHLPPHRPNAPLRAPSPIRKSPKHVSPHHPPPWTRSTLAAERDAFFHTRVTGRREVWDALHLICQFLRDGELAQAQAILDAVGLNCPNGRLAVGSSRRGEGSGRGGVFDEAGEVYEVPGWVVCDPADLVEEGAEGVGEGSGGSEGEEDGEGGWKVEAGFDKGKEKEEDVGEMVTLRVRASDLSGDLAVQVGMKQKVGVVIMKLRDAVGKDRRLRLVYLGRPWDNRTRTLEEEGYVPGHMVNCMIFDDVVEDDEKQRNRRT